MKIVKNTEKINENLEKISDKQAEEALELSSNGWVRILKEKD